MRFLKSGFFCTCTHTDTHPMPNWDFGYGFNPLQSKGYKTYHLEANDETESSIHPIWFGFESSIQSTKRSCSHDYICTHYDYD